MAKKFTKNNKKKVPRKSRNTKKHVGGMKLTQDMFANKGEFFLAQKMQEKINKNKYTGFNEKKKDIYKFTTFIRHKMINDDTKNQQIAQNNDIIAKNTDYSSKGRQDLDLILTEYMAKNNGEEPDLNTKSIIGDAYRKLYEKHIEDPNSDDFIQEFKELKDIATNKTNIEILSRATDTEIIAAPNLEAATDTETIAAPNLEAAKEVPSPSSSPILSYDKIHPEDNMVQNMVQNPMHDITPAVELKKPTVYTPDSLQQQPITKYFHKKEGGSRRKNNKNTRKHHTRKQRKNKRRSTRRQK